MATNTAAYGTGADADAAAGLRRRTAAPEDPYTPLLEEDLKKTQKPKV
jgi:hypothetical protein